MLWANVYTTTATTTISEVEKQKEEEDDEEELSITSSTNKKTLTTQQKSSCKTFSALSSTNTASITPTFKTNSKKTRRLNDFFTLTKLVFTTVPFLLSLFSTVQASTTGNILRKRYSANALCPLLGVGEKYCEPTANQTFTSIDWIPFAWNTLASPFPVEGALDIYLRRTQGTKIVESRKHVSNDLGQYSFQPQNYWFEPYDPQANNTFEFFFVATPLNQSPDDLTDSGPRFYITQLPPPTQSTSAAIITVSAQTITTTASSELDNGSQFDSSKHSSIATPIIVIIVVAGFLLLVAIAGLAFVILTRSRSKKKRPQSISNISTSSNIPIMVQTNFLDKDKHKSGEPESPIEASSIHSTTPLATKNSMSSLSQKLAIAGGIGVTTTTTTTSTATPQSGQTPPQSVSFSSESNLLQHQQPPAFDAAMISDAYRQTLRKPDWQEEDDDEEFDTEIGLSEEERRRRREAKEIMKQELAEEGRGLHSVQRHTKVQVHKIDEDEDAE